MSEKSPVFKWFKKSYPAENNWPPNKWILLRTIRNNGSCINHGTNGKIKKTSQIKEFINSFELLFNNFVIWQIKIIFYKWLALHCLLWHAILSSHCPWSFVKYLSQFFSVWLDAANQLQLCTGLPASLINFLCQKFLIGLAWGTFGGLEAFCSCLIGPK